MPVKILALISIEQHWSALGGISDQCHDFNWHWALIQGVLLYPHKLTSADHQAGSLKELWVAKLILTPLFNKEPFDISILKVYRFHELKCPAKQIFKAIAWGQRNKIFYWGVFKADTYSLYGLAIDHTIRHDLFLGQVILIWLTRFPWSTTH